ncbi:tripartite motif-containing protein 45-like [Mercenaria mercenaria]|uniref:tripartite motif-containing protein 45-like n=1 Tax=Mercenaria mercenaria TaxID=6596 RepID=UPI00234EB0A1|nr:tripartite motif-containing protein 45-like [Mercenaria mercenaria]
MEASATVYCYECSEKLCEKCKDMHKKVKISSIHRLCDINKQEDVAKLEHLKSLTRCPKHLSDEVRYICKDHDQMCCNECAILEHRKCNEVVSIAKEQVDIGRSVYGTSYKLQQLIEYLEVLIGYETKHQSTVKACKTEMKDKFKQIKKRIDSAFYAMEKAVFGEFEEKSSLILKESTLHKEEIESLQSEIKHSLVEMETAKEFGQPLHLFLVDRILQNQLAKFEDSTSQIHDKMSKTVVRVIEDNICKELDRNIAACLKMKIEPSGFAIPSIPRILKYKSWLEATETNVRRQTKALYHSSNTKRYVPVIDHSRPQDRNKKNEESTKPDINVRNVVFNGADDDFGEIDDNDTRLDDLESIKRVSCSRLQKKDKRKHRKN